LLFGQSASSSLAAFPLRVVYHLLERREDDEPVQMLVSVPKKRFHHAVDRNRVKRQVREAYRKNKHLILDALASCPQREVDMALIWLDGQLHDSEHVERQLRSLLQRLAEQLSHPKPSQPTS
jgi:ribonuclease P protein component